MLIRLFGNDVLRSGNDTPFVNNYGVWVDELKDLELDDALELIWTKAVCYFGEEQEVSFHRLMYSTYLYFRSKLDVLTVESISSNCEQYCWIDARKETCVSMKAWFPQSISPTVSKKLSSLARMDPLLKQGPRPLAS